ncbi:hypothetical protein GCM10010964_13450 [Caldovatus sediminis]|uniref:SPW repeat-containing integral membrane domain-containing protein n=1 Tax=Caldovatus sediminis TaxID=2041189 RepID=A0A8J2ZAB0_9PROT|nr:SPW repeat protein [Caldovatus sediminis]GGG26855.1 hypothetical protein GCM10010964_13450 [Caldovatus sediminis]
MRFVTTRTHGVIDYVIGVVLILAPWLLGFANGGAAQWVTVALGAILIVYSLFTNYELGLMRSIPMPTHLVLDAVGGIVLVISPWLFGFAHIVWLPHVLIGLLEIVMSFVTERVPGARATAGGLP